MRRSRYCCRSATSPRTSCARSPTSRGSTRRKRSAPRLSRTLSSAGSAKRICRRFIAELKAASLARAGAGTIVDVVACPGTDTCKLGISSSRGLAGELRMRLLERGAEMDTAIRGLHIKVSGCFNSCGQHHICRSRLLRHEPREERLCGAALPGRAGRPMGRRTPARTVWRSARCRPSAFPKSWIGYTTRYVAERTQGETFHAFIKRIGKAECKKMIEDLTVVPPHEAASELLSGLGRCARVYSRRSRRRRVRRRSSVADRIRADGVRAGGVRSATATRKGRRAEGGGDGLCGDASCGARAAEVPWRGFPRGSAIPSQRGSAACFTTRSFSWIRSPAASSRSTTSRRMSARARRTRKSSRTSLIEEAQLFIEASHSCYAKMLAEPAVAHV